MRVFADQAAGNAFVRVNFFIENAPYLNARVRHKISADLPASICQQSRRFYSARAEENIFTELFFRLAVLRINDGFDFARRIKLELGNETFVANLSAILYR